jgi:hypothetical protein
LALLDVVDERRLRRIVAKLADMAEAGDLVAAKLVLLYTIGKPTRAVNPDLVDQDEVALLMASPDVREVLSAARDRLPAGVALRLLGDLLRDAPERLAAMLDAAQRNPPPPPLTQARFEQLLAEARSDHGPEYALTT